MKRALGYIRVSKDPKREKLSPAIQRERIRDYCKAKKWDLVNTLEDIDTPGATFDRPGWQELEARDDYDVVIATEFTRIGRSLRETVNRIEALHEGGHDVVAIDDDIDTTTASGKMMFHVILALAQFERDRLSERLRATHAQIAREGRWYGGPLPLGYRYREGNEIEVDEGEADLVRRIFTLRLSGHGLGKIASVLHDEGTRGKRGATPHPNSIKRILENRGYVGEREYQGEIYSAGIPAIVERKQWDSAQAMRRRDRGKRSSKYLLSGLLHCGRCGQKMYRRKRYDRPGEVDYVCKSLVLKRHDCSGVSIREHVAEKEILSRFFSHLDQVEYAQAVKRQKGKRKTRDGRLAGHKQRLASLEHKQEKLLDLYLRDDGTLTRSQFNERNTQLMVQTESIKEKCDSMEADVKLSEDRNLGDIRKDWGLLDTEARREVLGGFVDYVQVKPRREGPKRIRIRWKI